MQAQHLAHGFPVGRDPMGGHIRGDPGRLDLALPCRQVVLAAAQLGQDQACQAGPDDETDDEEPPVELDVHRRGRSFTGGRRSPG